MEVALVEPCPMLVERKPGIVNLAVRTMAGARSYSFGAALTLDAAFGGTTPMFEVPANGVFSSPTLRRTRANAVYESNRGLTRVQYDPVDYASSTIPGDTYTSFVRVQERNQAGTLLAPGPILVVPPGDYFSTARRNLTLNGTAPNVSGVGYNNYPPPGVMRFVLPQFAGQLQVMNTGATNTLYVSFGQGLQETPIPPTVAAAPVVSVSFWFTGEAEVFIRAQGGTTPFTLIASIVNGLAP
jgi:hypothetical protein